MIITRLIINRCGCCDDALLFSLDNLVESSQFIHQKTKVNSEILNLQQLVTSLKNSYISKMIIRKIHNNSANQPSCMHMQNHAPVNLLSIVLTASFTYLSLAISSFLLRFEEPLLLPPLLELVSIFCWPLFERLEGPRIHRSSTTIPS